MERGPQGDVDGDSIAHVVAETTQFEADLRAAIAGVRNPLAAEPGQEPESSPMAPVAMAAS